jgi:adenosine 3'-phospho 5'-phosphosulfate transporter B2
VGILLNRKSYPPSEYFEALAVTLGVTMFTLSEKHDKSSHSGIDHSNSIYGLCLLGVYLFCDAFTSQWQSRVYKQFSIDQYQMMLGVNIWSMCMTGVTLFHSGEFFSSLAFILSDSNAFLHMTILSITSATGQLFIFYTIKELGPVIFTIIMTTRQIFSLFVSCLLFAHPLGKMAWISSLTVFGIVFNRIYRKGGD